MASVQEVNSSDPSSKSQPSCNGVSSNVNPMSLAELPQLSELSRRQTDPADCNHEHPLPIAQQSNGVRKKYTLKQKILFALHSTKLRPVPAAKEMQESFAFFEKTQSFFKRHDVIIDVCGSHGMLSYLFAIYCKTPHLYVIDAHRPDSFETIGKVLEIKKGAIDYIERDLYEALPGILALWRGKEQKVAVIACHACSHLSDSIMDICCQFDLVEFALMPCCQSRKTMNVGNIVDSLNLDLYHRDCRKRGMDEEDIKRERRIRGHRVMDPGMVKDLIMFGRGVQMGYAMRWKMIESRISPQNRILFGLRATEKQRHLQKVIVDKRKIKMSANYQKLHKSRPSASCDQ